jgi:hypothetical protein
MNLHTSFTRLIEITAVYSSVLQNRRYVSLGTCSKVTATSYASICVWLLGTLIYEGIKLGRARKLV